MVVAVYCCVSCKGTSSAFVVTRRADAVVQLVGRLELVVVAVLMVVGHVPFIGLIYISISNHLYSKQRKRTREKLT